MSGRFNLGFMHAPFDIKLRLTVVKTGYKPFVKDFMASDAHRMMDENQEFKVVLEKEGAN